MIQLSRRQIRSCITPVQRAAQIRTPTMIHCWAARIRAASPVPRGHRAIIITQDIRTIILILTDLLTGRRHTATRTTHTMVPGCRDT